MALGDKVQLNLDVEQQTAQLSIEMSDGLQINMLNGSYPIGNGMGQLVFTPATQTENARIGVEVSLQALVAGQLGNIGTVATLPNGSPLPVAIQAPLLSIPVYKANGFDVDALLSITPELQIATTVGIPQMNSQYVPAGLAVCQNFRNEQNLAFAAICLYGPGSGKNGGIFVGANLGDVFDFATPAPQPNMAMAMSFASAPEASFLRAMQSVSISSSDWSEELHNPRKVSNRNLLTAKRNVAKILAAKR